MKSRDQSPRQRRACSLAVSGRRLREKGSSLASMRINVRYLGCRYSRNGNRVIASTTVISSTRPHTMKLSVHSWWSMTLIKKSVVPVIRHTAPRSTLIPLNSGTSPSGNSDPKEPCTSP
eukprot:5307262-Pyramimonas_sp.AAC.1